MSRDQTIPDDESKSRRQLIEELAEKSQNRYQRLFASMREGFALAEIILDEAGMPFDYRLMEVNEAFGQLTGLPPETAVGKTARELVPGASPEWFEILGRVAITGEPERFEGKDPKTGKWFEIYAFSPEKGKFGYLFMDITSRKHAEQKLTDAYRMLESVTNSTHVLLACLDSRFNFRWVNRAYAEAGRRDPGGYIGKNHFELYPHAENEAVFRRVVASGKPFRASAKPFFHPDQPERGNTYWDWRLEPLLDANGNVELLLFSLTDVTETERTKQELRESEARLRALVDNLPFEIWAMGKDGRYIIENRVCQLVWGGRTGRRPEEVTTDPAVLSRWQENNSRAFSGEVVTGETSAERSGQVRVFHSIVAPVRVGDEISGILGVNLDITEHKQAENELRELNATLEQRISERTELAETRAKQLQSITIELIEAEEKERQRIAQLLHEDLQQILASARLQLQTACQKLPPQKLLTRVDRLLEESIGKSRTLSHELSPPILRQYGLFAALQWLARQMKEQFGLEVRFETQASREFEYTPLKVFIFRAVQELLFNIVKHAGVKKAFVTVSNSNGDFVVTVTDQGRGFNPDILASYDVKAGLGLLALRERATFIGGNLAIESSPGCGSRFTLTVPQHLAESRDPPPGDRARNGRPSRPDRSQVYSANKGTRVVFADDHQVMRQALVSMLDNQEEIAVVGEASDGREALEIVRRLRPDVVIMDVSMPVMDGVEATRRIKQEFPGVRVVGLSMYDDEQIALSMSQAGADGFLSKTASPAQLLSIIHKVSRKRD